MKIITCFILFFYLFSLSCYAQLKKISDFGFNEVDATNAVELAFNSNYDTLVFDYNEKPWIVKPINFIGVNNKVVIFEEKTEICAKKNSFLGLGDVLLEFTNCSNIQFIGSNNLLKMNKDEYIEGEWRHVISLRGCKDFKISDFIIRDSGGDGVYIAGSKERKYSDNIYIDNISSINNKRQGMSIISAKNVFVSNSTFSETKGALPEAGLDIEPNKPEDVIVNINFINCDFFNNYHAGIKLALDKLNHNSENVSISFVRCVIKENHDESNRYAPAELVFGADKDNPVKGYVLFEDCLIKNSQWPMIYTRKLAEAYTVHFNNCFVENVAQLEETAIISMEVPDYKNKTNYLGGFKFENLTIKTKLGSPIIQIRGSKLGTLKGVNDIIGNIILLSEKNNDLYNYINYSSFLNKNVNIDIVRRTN